MPAATIEREAAARVQAAEAKATQALADNDQRIAAIKREMAVAEAARGEALAEAAAVRDANTQLEGEVVPRLEAIVASLEERLESEQAAHVQALEEQAAEASAALESLRSKADRPGRRAAQLARLRDAHVSELGGGQVFGSHWRERSERSFG